MVEYSEEIERGNPNGHFGVHIFAGSFPTTLVTCENFPVGWIPRTRSEPSIRAIGLCTPMLPKMGSLMSLSRELLREVRALDEYDLRRLMLFAGELVAVRTGSP